MKINKKICMLFVLAFAFLFKIDMVSASGTTCVYEMWPVGYYTNDSGTPSAISVSTLKTAKVTFSGTSKDSYTLKHDSRMGGGAAKDFNEKSFAKEVFNSGKCPTYIYAKSSSVKSIDSTEFTKYQNTFLKKNSTNPKEYPMFLTKQNGKSVSKYATFSTELGLSNWVKIIKSGDNGHQPIAKVYYNSINSVVLAAVQKNANWPTFSDYALGTNPEDEDEKNLNAYSTEYSQANRQYCYYYCQNACKNSANESEKSSCTKTCESTDKPKCEKAYNACKKMKSTTDQNKCIATKFQESGLDTSYPTVRAQELKNLSNEIERLKETVAVKKASKIEVEVGTNTYKLTCDDVAIFHDIYVIIIIVAPILVILMGTLDFGRAVIAGSEEKMQKAWKRFPKRVLAVLLLFLVPLLISLILSISTDEGARDTNLMYCIINGGE